MIYILLAPWVFWAVYALVQQKRINVLEKRIEYNRECDCSAIKKLFDGHSHIMDKVNALEQYKEILEKHWRPEWQDYASSKRSNTFVSNEVLARLRALEDVVGKLDDPTGVVTSLGDGKGRKSSPLLQRLSAFEKISLNNTQRTATNQGRLEAHKTRLENLEDTCELLMEKL